MLGAVEGAAGVAPADAPGVPGVASMGAAPFWACGKAAGAWAFCTWTRCKEHSTGQCPPSANRDTSRLCSAFLWSRLSFLGPSFPEMFVTV